MVISIPVRLNFTEPVLASSPANPEVYTEFIAARKRNETPDATADEVATIPELSAEEREKIGSAVFHSDQIGLFVFDYHIRGFLKEAAAAISGNNRATNGIGAMRSKIDKWLFVRERRIYFLDSGGGNILVPDGTLERPIRCMTMQGPRVTVKRSDYIDAGRALYFTIDVLPLGKEIFTPDRLAEWFDYGRYTGLGEWRTGSYGRFVAEVGI